MNKKIIAIMLCISIFLSNFVSVFAVDLELIDTGGLSVIAAEYLSDGSSTYGSKSTGTYSYAKGIDVYNGSSSVSYSTLPVGSVTDIVHNYNVSADDGLLFKKGNSYNVTLNGLQMGVFVACSSGIAYFNWERANYSVNLVLSYSDGTSYTYYDISSSITACDITSGDYMLAYKCGSEIVYGLSFTVPETDKIVKSMRVFIHTEPTDYSCFGNNTTSYDLDYVSYNSFGDYTTSYSTLLAPSFYNLDIDVETETSYTGILTSLSGGITGLLSGLQRLLLSSDNIFSSIGDIFYEIYTGFNTLPTNLWAQMSGAFESLETGNFSIVDAVSAIPLTLWEHMPASFTGMISDITNLPANLWDSFNLGLQTLFIPSSDVMSSKVDELKGKYPLVDTMSEFANMIVDTFEDFLSNDRTKFSVNVSSETFYLAETNLLY